MSRALILFTFFGFAGSALAGNHFEYYQKLANSGAKQLAIAGLQKAEPDKRFDEQRWLEWLTEIIALYEWDEDWAAAEEKLRQLPSDIGIETRRWAETKRVTLALKRGKPELARRLLQRLLWRPSIAGQSVYRQPEASWSARWRRMVIDTYLQEKRHRDGAAAMRLYRQDYAVEGFIKASGVGLQKFPQDYQPISRSEMAELEARIAIALGDFSNAWRLLQAQNSNSLSLLKQYARLIARPRELDETARQLQSYAADKQRGLAFRKSAYVLLAKARALSTQPSEEVQAIMGALSIVPLDVHSRPELAVPPVWYWQNLSAIGSGLIQAYFPKLTPEKRLLEAAKVQSLYERTAIYLRLAQGQESGFANRALNLAFATAQQAGVSEAGLVRLFVEALPDSLQQQYESQLNTRLVNALMARNDLLAASKRLLAMPAGSPLTGDFNWHLRRARIHLLGGRPVLGAKILAELLLKDLDAAQYDRLLQVVFDVQTVGLHEYALDLLLLMQPKQMSSPKRQREMWYWIAEAHKALDQHGEAAAAYLFSADFLQDNATDQWAVSARLAAAEQLVAAGLAGDAKNLYEFLLLTARKDNVRAMLRTKIQRLSVETF